MKNNIEERINNASLSKIEKKIAKILISDIFRNAFLTGPQFAALCDVAPSTVTRFAQKIGYKGYPDLKKEMEKIYRTSTTPFEVYESFLENSKDKSVTKMSYEQDLTNLANMYNQLDEDKLDKVVDLIDRANNIYIAGIGSSEAVVEIFRYYLDALGKNFALLKGFGISKKFELCIIDKSDVLIAISAQRVLKEVQEVALFAKKKNCATIAITDSNFSPLASVCDYSLISPVTCTTFSLSHAANVVLVNIIVNKLAAKNPDEKLEKLRLVQQSWNELPIFCNE